MFILDTLPVFVNIRKRYCRTGWTEKNKLQTLVHILILMNFTDLYFTTLCNDAVKVSGIFSNHFITNFPQNVQVINFEDRSLFNDAITEVCGLLFGATMYIAAFVVRRFIAPHELATSTGPHRHCLSFITLV